MKGQGGRQTFGPLLLSFSAVHHQKAGVVAVRMAKQEGECRASSAYGKAPTNQLCSLQT